MERAIARHQGESFDFLEGLPGSGLSAYVVRNGFRDVTAAERQRWLAELFEEEFGTRSRQIGLVLTFTPEEFEGWFEDQED